MSELEAVNLHGELRSFEALANSLVIADKLDIEHKYVLRKIRSLEQSNPDEIGQCKFAPSNYLNLQGKSQVMYELDEIAAMWVITGFSSKKANTIRLEVIQGFYRLSKWIGKRDTVADAHNYCMAALEECRIDAGKSVVGVHWEDIQKNESKLMNGIMTGVYKSNPRDGMSEEESTILIDLYRQDISLLEMGFVDYSKRKPLLVKWYAKRGYPQFERTTSVRAPKQAKRLPFSVID